METFQDWTFPLKKQLYMCRSVMRNDISENSSPMSHVSLRLSVSLNTEHVDKCHYY